jgi:hypothetical protein
MHSDEHAATRRQLICRTIKLGALAGAGSLASVASAEAAAPPSDAELLLPILGTELLAIYSYRAILHSALMSESAQRLAARCFAQEHAHIGAFKAALEQLGGTPPQPLKTVSAADAVLAAHHIPNRLAHLRTERDCLTILVRVENVLANVYHTAISQLNDPQLIELSAQVLACEAQHATVLNLALHPHDIDRAVPSSYVQ